MAKLWVDGVLYIVDDEVSDYVNELIDAIDELKKNSTES